MTTRTTAAPGEDRTRVQTARITGLFYTGMIFTAVFGYFVIPGRIFDPQDAGMTLRQLAGQETLARLGIALVLALATFQALLALGFFKLFRPVDGFAAAAVLVLGMGNAILVYASAAFLGTALDVALDPSLGSIPATAQLMYVVSGNFWKVVTVFFGMWLLPMGLLVLRSGWMPRPMGWLLIIGGVGYVIHAFVQFLAPGAASISAILVWPTISEFWMAGYLLTKGVRRPATAGVAP